MLGCKIHRAKYWTRSSKCHVSCMQRLGSLILCARGVRRELLMPSINIDLHQLSRRRCRWRRDLGRASGVGVRRLDAWAGRHHHRHHHHHHPHPTHSSCTSTEHRQNDRLLGNIISMRTDKSANLSELLMARLKGQICNGYSCSSVRCPFHGHVSKTKQDRPIITVDRWCCRIHFRSSPRRPLGSILVSNTKCVQTLIYSSTWCQSDYCCCKPSTTVVSPPMLSTAVNGLRRLEHVVHIHCPLCWRRQSRTGSGLASFRSAMFLFQDVLVNLYLYFSTDSH